MKILLTYLVLIAFMTMNIASAAHADCIGVACGGIEVTQAVQDSDTHDSGQDSASSCCITCGHHHHTQAFLPYSDAERFVAFNKATNSWDGTIQPTQLHYPPARPPRA